MTDITDSSRGDATEPFPQREFDIEKPERPRLDTHADGHSSAFDVIAGLSRHVLPPLCVLVVAMHLDNAILRTVGIVWLGFWVVIAIGLVLVRLVLLAAGLVELRLATKEYKAAMREYEQAQEANGLENAVMSWLTGHADELPEGMDGTTCWLNVIETERLPFPGDGDGDLPRSVILMTEMPIGEGKNGSGEDVRNTMSEYLSQSATTIAKEALSLPYGTFLHLDEHGATAFGVLAASEDGRICDDRALLAALATNVTV